MNFVRLINFVIILSVRVINMLLFVWGAQAIASDGVTYVGSKACISCHQEQYQQWKTSDHYKAMALASPNSVLGDFSDTTVTFHSVANRFFSDGLRYFVEIKELDLEPETHEIKYTFGHYPLQQYLIELEDGFVQALNATWDSRTNEEGGQRWFHLQPGEGMTPEHPFHWKNHFQNWNARCSDCHSTNLRKNYDRESHTYSTTWSEMNVGCEACHGPGSDHVRLVDSDEYGSENSGFSLPKPRPIRWQFQEGDAIASPVGQKDDRHINMCGRCHSLSTPLVEAQANHKFHEANRLMLIAENSYYPDGQIREEVYVMGSFMQSKMYEQGVTCTNCHEPHSGKMLVKGNGLCVQCHQPVVYDTPDHHHHPKNSTGAQCVSCHMPERTFMQVDERRDHSFTVPDPGMSIELGVPNACTQCHSDQGNEWASTIFQEWGIKEREDHWAYLNQRLQSGDVLVARSLTSIVDQGSLPKLVSASLLAGLSGMPSRESVKTAVSQLQDEDPLIRRAAVTSLQNLPAELRWQVLSQHINDPNRSVRFEIAGAIADVQSRLPVEQQHLLDPLIDEYRASLKASENNPATQLSTANLEMRLGDPLAAENAMLHALRIEPNYVPALINLADYYRDLGRNSEAESLLQRALAIAPDSGVANHSYGLHLVRQKHYDEALTYLKEAIEQVDALPRFTYVYAVALESTGEPDKAIEILVEANNRWPNQYDLLFLLVGYLEKSGGNISVSRYVSNLSEIAPNDPGVQKLVQKYIQ